VLALVAVTPALADVELRSSDPEAGSTVANPLTTVSLTFSGGLEAGKSSFRVVGPSGDVGTGRASEDGVTEMALDGLTLAPGSYEVRWTAAAEDGHLTRGTFEFAVTDPTPPPATPTPLPSATPSEAPQSSPSPSPAATPAPSPGGGSAPAASTSDLLLPIAAALALVALVGWMLLRPGRAR